MSATATIIIQVADVHAVRRRHQVSVLRGAPNGARVILNVEDLNVDYEVVRHVHEHADRLAFDVHAADPGTAHRWVYAIRTGRNLDLDPSGMGFP